MKDCRECKHSLISRSRLMCVVENFSKPVEYMRDYRSQCGLEAVLFEPKQERRYSEYDEE